MGLKWANYRGHDLPCCQEFDRFPTSLYSRLLSKNCQLRGRFLAKTLRTSSLTWACSGPHFLPYLPSRFGARRPGLTSCTAPRPRAGTSPKSYSRMVLAERLAKALPALFAVVCQLFFGNRQFFFPFVYLFLYYFLVINGL